MFKCKDCGCEYKEKPDFCDCGNDTFDEIPEPQPQNFEYDKNTEIIPKKKKTFKEQYPMLSSFMGTLDPISVIIFVLCIALSIGSFFVIKPKENTETPQEQAAVKNEPRTVPDINTFWDDTPPKKEIAVATPESDKDKGLIAQVVDMIPKKEENKTPVAVTTTPKKEQPKPAVKTTPKTNTKTQTQTGTKKTTPAKQNTQPKTQPKQQTQPVAQTTPAQTKVNNPPSQTTPTTPPVVTTPQQTTVVPVKNEQEWKSYKDGLKRTLFAKMNMLNVYGDGSCVVDFKVDSNGKLTGRSFSKQSDNNTLNDEVYKAIISTPTYKVPPSGYAGQTLHFSVKITNGKFSVTLN